MNVESELANTMAELGFIPKTVNFEIYLLMLRSPRPKLASKIRAMYEENTGIKTARGSFYLFLEELSKRGFVNRHTVGKRFQNYSPIPFPQVMENLEMLRAKKISELRRLADQFVKTTLSGSVIEATNDIYSKLEGDSVYGEACRLARKTTTTHVYGSAEDIARVVKACYFFDQQTGYHLIMSSEPESDLAQYLRSRKVRVETVDFGKLHFFLNADGTEVIAVDPLSHMKETPLGAIRTNIPLHTEPYRQLIRKSHYGLGSSPASQKTR